MSAPDATFKRNEEVIVTAMDTLAAMVKKSKDAYEVTNNASNLEAATNACSELRSLSEYILDLEARYVISEDPAC